MCERDICPTWSNIESEAMTQMLGVLWTALGNVVNNSWRKSNHGCRLGNVITLCDPFH